MRLYDIGKQEGPEVVHDRILTVPNLLSFARLATLPIVYLDLVNGRHLRALVLIGVFSSTDWFDGYIARRFNQVSRLGKLLDPLADRLLLATVAIGMVVGDIVPLWVMLVVIARDVILLGGAAAFMRRDIPPPPVTYLGKSATFGLMFAFPTFLLASVLAPEGQAAHELVRTIAWAMLLVALPLYYATGVQYVQWALRAMRAEQPTEPGVH